MKIIRNRITSAVIATVVMGLLALLSGVVMAQQPPAAVIDSSTLRGKVMCGYQGWFRCPGDPAGLGWIHWSRDSGRIAPDTLSFEMWPDMTEATPQERFPAPGFTYPDGRQAELYSAAQPETVLRHFEWMRTYGIDGIWLQHFVVDLPGGPVAARYPTRLKVLKQVQVAAQKTGRVWALSYDIAGAPNLDIYRVLTEDWKKMVDTGITKDGHYLHEGQRPVVQIWGFYHNNAGNQMTADLARRLIAFFHAPGPYHAYLVGGGDWDWRRNPDPEWQACLGQLDAYVPWNIGNYIVDGAGVKSASMGTWADDKREMDRRKVVWIPSLYAGFSWDNLTQKAPGSSTIPRRGGKFLWEQFYQLSQMHGDSAYIGMFDEVDEGTAIFKVTSQPPTQAHFVGYDGLPSDWYLRLVGEGARMLHGQRPPTAEIPIKP